MDKDEVKKRVLEVLSDNGELYVSELMRALNKIDVDTSFETLNKAIDELEGEGPITTEMRGNNKWVHLKQKG